MLRFKKDSREQTADHRLQMSPMIDIVFLLLVFFVMTFRITSQEGDFALQRTEVGSNAQATITTNLPLVLKLDATPGGELIAMSLDGKPVASFDDLQARLIDSETNGALQDVVMTLDCDFDLKYESMIAVLDHVTAYRDVVGQLKPLVASTRFATRH